MSFFSKGLPNFNQLMSDLKVEHSRQDLVNILNQNCGNNSQKFIIEDFENDSSNTINEYIKKQIDYIETAIKSDVAFSFCFISTSFKSKKSNYGLPYSLQEKIEKQGTSNSLMFINILYEINNMLNEQKKAVLRDIYYKNVEIYGKKQKNFNYIFEKLLLTLRVDRQVFSIGAAQKGEYYSHQNLNLSQNNKLNVLISGKNLIPNSNNHKISKEITITNINAPLNLLIVEKDAVFSDIIDNMDDTFLERWLLVTGRGQPDKLTLNFVCKLFSCKQLKKVFVLTDLDPYGTYIGLNYINSILEFSEINKKLSTESSLEYLGVKLFDILFAKKRILNNENVNKILISFQIKDYRIATNCIKKLMSNKYLSRSNPIKDLLTETQRQIFFGYKVEINSLNNGDVCNWLTNKICSID